MFRDCCRITPEGQVTSTDLAAPGDPSRREVDVGVARAVELLQSGGSCGYLSFEWEKKWHPELAPPEKVFPAYVKSMREMIGG